MLNWFNNINAYPKTAKLKNKATFEANLLPEKKVASAPTKSKIKSIDTFIV